MSEYPNPLQSHYIEITLLAIGDEQDALLYSIWQNMYSQLHLAFADAKQMHNLTFGVCFPLYHHSQQFATLGTKVRIFGNQTTLNKLALEDYFWQIDDYIKVHKIKQVPKTDWFAVVSRVRMETQRQFERSYQRLTTKHPDLPKQDYAPKRNNFPYIKLKSASTGKDFPLTIKQTLTQEQRAPMLDSFNTYGLSVAKTAQSKMVHDAKIAVMQQLDAMTARAAAGTWATVPFFA